MSATIIDGKAVAAAVREQIARDVAELTESTGRAPGLATVLVGDDPASAIYVANKRKALRPASPTTISTCRPRRPRRTSPR
jgi:methylenetetrahydrofolate dehydrogenase (NADP+)/methenyltetrahydrofolate cyclohydrolase